MSMTETPDTAPAPKPRPARKARRKRPARAAAAPKPPKVPAEFAGITVKNCPDACSGDRCIISNSIFCAHPHKGGLQATLQTPETLRRLDQAKAALGKKTLDLTAPG